MLFMNAQLVRLTTPVLRFRSPAPSPPLPFAMVRPEIVTFDKF